MSYESDREEITFNVECTMNKRWARQFIGMLKRMQELGGVGSSREVKFFADGDGDFRPTFKIESDSTAFEVSKGQGKENLFFYAG